jgi:hypothetical protein
MRAPRDSKGSVAGERSVRMNSSSNHHLAGVSLLAVTAMGLGACGPESLATQVEEIDNPTSTQVSALTSEECKQHPEARAPKGWLKNRFEACFTGHQLVELKCKNCTTKLASVEFDYTLFAFGYDGDRRVDYVLQFDTWKPLGGIERETSTLRVTFNGCGRNCSPSSERISLLRDWDATRRFQMTFTSPESAGSGELVVHQVFTSMDMEIRTPSRPDFDPWYRPNMATLILRFDSAGAKAGKAKGGVFPDFTPTFKPPGNQDARDVREFMRHIDDALHHPERTEPKVLGKSIPGERVPLHRLFNDSEIDRNRSASTRFCQSPRPNGFECDEYPFASTYEGAATAVLKPWNGSVRLIPADDNDKGGRALKDFYLNNRVLDDDAFFVTVDPQDIAANISCSVFDDGFTNLAGPSDAIFFSDGKACIPSGTSAGQCRKWFGRCTTENGAPVLFRVFDDGGAGASALSDAVFINDDDKACVPDAGSGYCKKWFGSGEDTAGEKVECRLFGDGYNDTTGPTDAIFYNGEQSCLPDGTGSGTCRKWWGRCQVASLGPVLPGGMGGGGVLPDIAPRVSFNATHISVDSNGTATLQPRVASGGQPLTVSWTYRATSDVDAGATCSFSDPTSIATTLSCTDDGTFDVTITVSDGVHPPAMATAQVVIPNRPPTLILTAAPEPWSVHLPLETQRFVAAVSDPEANDTLVCTINWDDGTTERLTPTSGVCSFEHAFGKPGMYTIRIAVEDDDGGRAEDERMIIVWSPGDGSVSGAGKIRDFGEGGAPEYRTGSLNISVKNLVRFGSHGHVNMGLETATDDLHRFEADLINWLIVPETNHFALKAEGTLYTSEGVRQVGAVLYGLESCVPPHRCDPAADKIRLILFDGADAYPTVSNIFYDSQPGTSVDLDDFVPAVTMDPGALNMRPF